MYYNVIMDFKTEVHFDQKEQEIRYVESRLIEEGILEELVDVWKEMRKPETKRSQYANNRLENDLQRRYNDWQFPFDETEIGLNSGGCGEAFMRLLGDGIMSDMPVVGPLPKTTEEYGVHHIKTSKGKKGVAVVEVTTNIGRGAENYRGCKFRFETSLNALNDRLKIIREEIIQAKKEYSQKS